MSQTLPDSIRAETLPNGVRYVLPRRDLGGGRWLGLLPLGVGLAVTVFMLFWMGGPISGGIAEINRGSAFGWLLIGFGCLGLFGLVIGLGVLGLGLAIVTNVTHSEIVIRNGQLRAIERFGIMRWTRKRHIEAIDKLEIGEPLIGDPLSGRSGDNTIHIGGGLDPSLATIRALGDDMKMLIVAPGYPRKDLQALAAELSHQLSTGGRERLFNSDEHRVEIVQRPPRGSKKHATRPADEQPIGRPRDARSTLDERADGLTITVPPMGFFKGSKGLAFGALLWNALVSVFIVILVLAQLGVISNKDGDMPGWFGLVCMTPFAAIGVAMLVGAWNMGRRRAILDVVGDVLLVSRQSMFGTKQHEWPADRIERIGVGPSGMEVNNRPVMQLQIHPAEGRKVGLLSQLHDEELEWIAYALRRALRVK